MIDFLINKATESNIHKHLSECDADFLKALVERIDIKEYSKKIFDKSLRFEAWANNDLVGLVAAYCNDQNRRMAYITSVSVLKEWQNHGIANQLINMCIEYIEKLGIHCISLEVTSGNTQAIKLYEKHGFSIAEDMKSSIIMKLLLERGEGTHD